MYLLESTYTKTSKKSGTVKRLDPSVLKGSDRSDCAVLKKVCDSLGFTLYIAPVTKETTAIMKLNEPLGTNTTSMRKARVNPTRIKAWKKSKPKIEDCKLVSVDRIWVD